MKSSLLKLHRLFAVVLILPLAWLTFTGVILIFADDISRIVNVDIETVSPEKNIKKTKQSTDEAIAQVAKKYPNYEFISANHSSNISDSLLTIWKDKKGISWQIFINPYNGKILGKRLTSDNIKTIITKLHKFGYTSHNTWLKYFLNFMVIAGTLLLMLGFWHFVEKQLTTTAKKPTTLHAILGLIFIAPMLIIFISSIFIINADHQLALMWHAGTIFGIGGKVVWFWSSFIFGIFAVSASYSYLKSIKK